PSKDSTHLPVSSGSMSGTWLRRPLIRGPVVSRPATCTPPLLRAAWGLGGCTGNRRGRVVRGRPTILYPVRGEVTPVSVADREDRRAHVRRCGGSHTRRGRVGYRCLHRGPHGTARDRTYEGTLTRW